MQTNQTLWIVRHAERIDAVNPDWKKSAAEPENPPLTDKGLRQAQCTAEFIATDISKQILLRSKNQEKVVKQRISVLSSPFLRCVQTAQKIYRQLLDRLQPFHMHMSPRPNRKDASGATFDIDIQFEIENGLSEWMSASYFKNAPAIPIISPSDEYKINLSQFPRFPESVNAMKSR